MINRTSHIRKHSRFPVRWPVLYGGEDFVSEGTVLDVTQTGWRVAGVMPVHPGMRLTLHLWPEEKTGQIRTHNATVLWVKGCEFALDVPELNSADKAWLTRFLDQKLSRWLVRDFQTPTSAVIREAAAASEERVKDRERGLDDVQAQVLARCIFRHGDPAKAHFAKPYLLEGEALRIARGIQARKFLRLRTGIDFIHHN